MLSVPADVSCDEWAFSLLPLDVDLLSMELPEFFRDYFLVSAGSLGLGINRWGHTWGPVGWKHGHNLPVIPIIYHEGECFAE